MPHVEIDYPTRSVGKDSALGELNRLSFGIEM